MPPSVEDGIVEAQRDGAEQRAPEEERDELPNPTPEREPDAAPGRPAQPIAPRAHDRDGEERQNEDGGQESHDGFDDRRCGQKTHDHFQDHERETDKQHGLQKTAEQLLAGPVIGEPVPLQLRLAQEVAPDLHLAPEIIEAQRDHSEEEIDDVNPEEGSARAVKRHPMGLARLRAGTVVGRLPLSRERRRRRAQWRPAGLAGRPRQLRQPALRALHPHGHRSSLRKVTS